MFSRLVKKFSPAFTFCEIRGVSTAVIYPVAILRSYAHIEEYIRKSGIA